MNNQKISPELVAANHQLDIQHKEIELRAAELILANKELKFQNKEKERRAAELILANKELQFQNSEKEKLAAELILANKELKFQNSEKETHSAELTAINYELRNAEMYQKEYIKGLEEIIHIISHKVRSPICQILGISNLMSRTNSKTELNTINGFIKNSAYSLDFMTKELCRLLFRLKNRSSLITKKKQIPLIIRG